MKRLLFSIVLLIIAIVVGFCVDNYYHHISSIVSNKPDNEQIDAPVALHGSSDVQNFRLTTYAKSFFARDTTGELIPKNVNGKRYFSIGEGFYETKRKFFSKNTSLIVMDPWDDDGAEVLNEHFRPIYRQKILPLVNKALALGISVFVLTNDQKKISVDYGSAVFPELQSLAENGRIHILFHQDFDDDSFTKFLKEKSINTLIYTGFASNICVIGRPMGMIPMSAHGFRLFFVPEASAAVEYKESWETGEVHKATTSLISQWVAELIKFEEFMNAAPGRSDAQERRLGRVTRSVRGAIPQAPPPTMSLPRQPLN